MAVTDHCSALRTGPATSQSPRTPRVGALERARLRDLRDLARPDPGVRVPRLEYMDWKSGGDTNFAPSPRRRELDCRGFWKPGEERPTGGRFTSNCGPSARRSSPRLESSAPTSAAVRVIKLEPQATTTHSARSTATTQPLQPADPTAGSFARGSSSPTIPTASCAHGTGPGRSPRSDDRGARPVAPRFALRRRHATPVHVVCHTGDAPATRSSPARERPALEAWIASELP